MIRLGLTGSIGMGKTTTAAMFAAAGVPVFDADGTVHNLYQGAAVPVVGEMFPSAVSKGRINRAVLSDIVLNDDIAMARLEKLVHPLVRKERQRFSERVAARGLALALFDIPLLFETDAGSWLDAVCVISARPEIQRERVLGRTGMTEAKFEAILARQWSDARKRRDAHFLVDTSFGMDSARRQVLDIVRSLRFMG